MFTTIFIISLCLGVVLLGLGKFKLKEVYDQPKTTYIKKGSFLTKLVIPLFLLSAFMLVLATSFTYNKGGYRTYSETAFGVQKVKFKAGFHYVGFLITDKQVYPNVITTSFSNEEKSRITYKGKPFSIRFNDATNATAEATVRWRLPDDEVSMIQVHKNYGSSIKLAQATLSEYSRACLRYSAQLMESETHYSGGQSRMQEDFRSQLQEGQYVLETKTEYVKDSLTREMVRLTTTFLRKDSLGVAIRIKSDIHKYNIVVDYAQIGAVDYESQVDDKLAKKIEASTRESVSKQELITAKQEALTAIEEGKKKIEETRAIELAEKEKSVIQAQKAKEVEKENALKAKYTADKIEEEGRAQAAANQALVNAGLTPQEKAQFELDKETIKWENIGRGISEANYPDVMVTGGADGGANPMEVIGLDFLMNIAERTNKK